MSLIEKWEKSSDRLDKLCNEIGDKISEMNKIAKEDGVPYYSISFRCRIPYAHDKSGGFDGMNAIVTRGNTTSDVLSVASGLNNGGRERLEILHLLFNVGSLQRMVDREWDHLQEILPKPEEADKK